MKSKFLAGVIATIVSIVVVVGLALVLALVLDIEPTKNWFTTTAAFLTIGAWLGVYNWLKPKDSEAEARAEAIKTAVETGVTPNVPLIGVDDFKNAYLRTKKVGMRGGVVLAIIGIGGVVPIIAFAEPISSGGAIAGLIILGLLGALGLYVIKKTNQDKRSIEDGTDELMNAVNNNVRDHVIWFHAITMEFQGAVGKSAKNHQIAVYTQGRNKSINLVFKNEQSCNEVLVFLGSCFPDAQTGYSEELRKEMKAKYGLKATR